jgi:hypothetical protein
MAMPRVGDSQLDGLAVARSGLSLGQIHSKLPAVGEEGFGAAGLVDVEILDQDLGADFENHVVYSPQSGIDRTRPDLEPAAREGPVPIAYPEEGVP